MRGRRENGANEVRMIPLDGRPHAASGITQWLGDSRAALRIVERFHCVGPRDIDYQFTV